MAIIKIENEKEFEKEVINVNELVLVDFYADWCAPCKMMAEVIEKLAVDQPELKICKINIDENREVASRYEVMSIPTMLLFEFGQVKAKSVGSKTKARLMQELGL